MTVDSDTYNEFMIRLEGFSEAHTFHELFPDCRVLPEYKNPYLRSSHEANIFSEGAAIFYLSLAFINFGGEL